MQFISPPAKPFINVPLQRYPAQGGEERSRKAAKNKNIRGVGDHRQNRISFLLSYKPPLLFCFAPEED